MYKDSSIILRADFLSGAIEARSHWNNIFLEWGLELVTCFQRTLERWVKHHFTAEKLENTIQN